jgi:hypothetical protein
MNQLNQRITETFEILNVCPASNLKAVYAIESESQKGRFSLECEDVHFIGTVAVTEKTFLDGNERNTLLSERNVGNRVLGLSLDDGYFLVCDECRNFLGLIDSARQSANDLHIPPTYPLEVKES